MKARVKIAETRTPDGNELVLYQHDRDFFIHINGQERMHSREHEAELELARLGCGHLAGEKSKSIFIAGLGMGYTLRQALDMLTPRARVMVSERSDAVINWNREIFGALNRHPIDDARVDLKTDDAVEIISRSQSDFDAILLHIDTGPGAMGDSGSHRIFRRKGIQACRRALREKGCLAVWSMEPSKSFEQLLTECGFHVRRFRVPTHKMGKSLARYVWFASESREILPPGGGEPRQSFKKKIKPGRARPGKRRK